MRLLRPLLQILMAIAWLGVVPFSHATSGDSAPFPLDTRNYDDSTPLFSVDTRAPDVIANTGIIDSGGTSFTISMEMLKVTGGGPITFTLVTAPVHGKLLLSGTEQGAGATFTQAQIDSGSLSYQRGAGDPLSDTFEVAAMDDDAGPLGGNLTFAVAGIPGASGSLFLVDTRNYTESADSTVHTDRRAHLTADTVPGSLRQAIANAAAGETVDFDDSLSGETVELDGAALVIKKAVRIEGSALAAGVTVDAGTGANRVFDVISGGALELEALTLKGGEAGTGRGGAIYGQTGSSVIVKRCTLTNHHALEGGAIFTLGPLLIENSTLTGNSGGYGGAVQCLGTPSSITCSTIAGNSATNGGGIYNKNTTLTLTNSIVAENGGEDIRNEMAHLSYAGANLVQSVILDADSGITGSLPLTVPPLLAPLGDYGGPTQTMAVLHESPAINAAGGNVPLTDQRGFARDDGAPDIGAYEFYVNASAGYVSWERGVTASPPAPKTHWLPVNDEDRDQSSNFAEYVGGDGPDMSAEFLAGEPNIYRDGNDRYFETKVRLRRDDSDLSFAVEFKADDGSPWATQALTTDGTDWILAAGRLEIPASGSTGPSGRPGVDVVHFRDTVAIAAGLAGMMRIRVSDRHGNVASTDLEGFYGSACLSGSDTALAQPFQRRPVFRGAAAAGASGVDRIKPAFLLPSQRLIPDVFANHFVRGLGGAGAGHFYRILGNTDLEVILEISPGEVPAFAVGQAFEIVPYWTLSTLFQSDMNPAVHDSSGDSVFGRRTTLMLSNITSTGTNLGAGGIYYRPESDTWKVAFDHDPSSSVGDNADGVGIEPDAYFTVRHRPVSDLTTLGICYGSVSPAALRVPISTLAGDSQDNPVGLGNGFSTTLEDLALRADSAFVDSLGTGIFARRDTLLVYDNALAAQLKVASAIYYYFDDGGGNTWWEAKSNTAVVAAETIFPPGSVGVWRATSSDGITRYWMRPQN